MMRWIRLTRRVDQCCKLPIRESGRARGTTGRQASTLGLNQLRKSREKKHEGITEVVKPFDWSYSTDYRGTLRTESPVFQKTTKPIPFELLKRPDPILFFDEVMLYEDEMADNGITMLSCKIRVMPQRLLLLVRFFMRLDGVMLRIRDTRIYVDFKTREVTREYIAKEEKYEVVREVRPIFFPVCQSILTLTRSSQRKVKTYQRSFEIQIV